MKGSRNSTEKVISAKLTVDEFVKNMLENVEPKSKLILGVSGGADSVYLFERCLELQKRLQLKIIVAHINHGLRGKESDTDEKFVKKLCEKNNVPFHVLRLQLKKRAGNVEEAGRDARYKYFEDLRKKLNADWIVVAHHLNDNIETMLFNLIRGAHLSGIKSMEPASPRRHLLRPLLGINKKEILKYMKKHRIAYRHDSSNDDTEFSRNWLRKKIIPLFPKLNENFEQTLKETLHSLAQTSHYLEQQCEKWLRKNEKKLQIELDTFLKEHVAFQKQLLVHIYKKIHGSTKKLTNKHLEEVLNVLHLRQANKKKEFGPKTFIEVARGQQTSAKANKKSSGRYIRLTTKK